MNKKQVQQRVLQKGKPLALSKFTWCEKTKTFSSDESNLVIDFVGIDYCTFKTEGYCTFDTGNDCTFKTEGYCTFKTGSDCTFNTGWSCTFDTGWGCTFNTGSDCTFKTGSDCVIVNRNVFEVITPKVKDVIQICPNGIEGHLVNGLYKGKPHIIADGILSEVIHKRGDVYTVINHGETEKSYLVTDGENWAHGDTIKSANEDLLFKSADSADKDQYRGLSLDTVKTSTEWAVVYRAITGACISGIRNFMSQRDLKDNYTLAEIIKETEGAYGHNKFKEFFKCMTITLNA